MLQGETDLAVVDVNAVPRHRTLHRDKCICATTVAQTLGLYVSTASHHIDQRCTRRTGGHLVAKATAAAVDHHAHLANLLDAHLIGRPLVINLIDNLHLGVVIAGAQCAQLNNTVLDGIDNATLVNTGRRLVPGIHRRTCGRPRFLARSLTLRASAWSMRPYSSQCSLSSGHAYPEGGRGSEVLLSTSVRGFGSTPACHRGRVPFCRDQSMPISRAWSSSAAVMGMTPREPTPTGMWSNMACASFSFTGATSASVRLVRSRRTPQLISKPTPPSTGKQYES